MQFILDFLNHNGGPVSSVISVLMIFNIVVSAAQKIFNQLKVAEPDWLKKIGDVGSSVTGWISANIPTQRPAAVAPPVEPPKA